MKAAVITFPGSNCDRDVFEVLSKLNAKVSKIFYTEANFDNDFDLIVIPGGFSYGDYLRSGAMAKISPAMSEVKRLSKKGVKILGICNGFQILTEAELLEGALLKNKKGKFICKKVYLKTINNNSDFTKNCQKDQILQIPIAHGDGNFFAEKETLKKLNDNNLIAFRYCDENGNISQDCNPNGSRENIAGIFNSEKNILGMMPHPERASDSEYSKTDGLFIFKSLLG
jgi:phosphoribosylformylglycinamidine synthase